MTSTTAPALPDSPAELLRAVRDQKKAADRADVEMMRLAVHWADLHIADPEFAEACFTSPKTFAGEGSPSIDEFCVPEFATMLGRTNDSAGRFLTECVEVAYRLPRLWGAVLSGLVAGWRARIIAQATLALTLEAATHVAEQVFWCASRLTPSQLGRVVDEARVRFMPDAVQKSLEDSADKRHVTFDTEQASFDGTMHLEADLEIPDALALAEAVTSGAEHLAKLGSTDTADGRRATALGDLARHQMTIGFDTGADDDGDASAGVEVRALRDASSLGSSGEPQRASKPSPAKKPVTQIHLYAHLSADAITHFDNPDAPDEALCGRIEQAGNRLLSVDQIRAWCGRPDVQVVVTKVIDLRERLECQGYRPTPEIREHVIVRDGTCVFPWCGRNARLCDLDHVIPYNHDDPEQGGPTATDNLAPLCRRHHRLKTRGRWRYEMTDPGVCSSGPARSATPTSATTTAADRPDGRGPKPGSRPLATAWTHRTGTTLRPNTRARIRTIVRSHTRPTSDHHAPDPASVAPAGPQARSRASRLRVRCKSAQLVEVPTSRAVAVPPRWTHDSGGR